MAETEYIHPTFEYGSDATEDLLLNAAHVLGFLTGVIGLSDAPPLEENNAHGLFLILTGVENTLERAREGLKNERKSRMKS
jgi:hypothetical protein